MGKKDYRLLFEDALQKTIEMQQAWHDEINWQDRLKTVDDAYYAVYEIICNNDLRDVGFKTQIFSNNRLVYSGWNLARKNDFTDSYWLEWMGGIGPFLTRSHDYFTLHLTCSGRLNIKFNTPSSFRDFYHSSMSLTGCRSQRKELSDYIKWASIGFVHLDVFIEAYITYLEENSSGE